VDKDPAETAEPYDLPFPEDHWPPGRPEYVIVVDQLRGRQPGHPPSLAELLEATRTRTRQPEPDLESRTMTLTINDTLMTSDHAAHTARHSPSRNGWEVSWLPGQTLDRNPAITAMILADLTGEENPHEGHRLWPRIQGWAAELGLTAPEAMATASQPPDGIHHDHQQHAGGRLDREAAD